MQKIILENPGAFSLQEAQEPVTLQDGEALVRVLRVGICGTDLHAFEGTQPFFSYPRVLGHELAIEVLEISSSVDVHHISVGDICAVEPYINCEKCAACQRGITNACMNMQVLGVHRDGGMQEIMSVPIRKLHPSKELPIEDLALTEMLSIGAHAVRRAQLHDDETVLVIGAGPIGMSTMLFARMMNTNVIAMDIDSERLAFCENVLGIAHIINAKDSPLEKLRSIAPDLPTTVFDATGNLGSMNQAFEYVSHGGKLVFVGLVNDSVTFHDPHFHSHEMTLFSSRNATSEDFAWVISSLASGKISLNGWITHAVNAQELVSQFSDWLQPGSRLIKAMLVF
jgi:hypothetical protein